MTDTNTNENSSGLFRPNPTAQKHAHLQTIATQTNRPIHRITFNNTDD